MKHWKAKLGIIIIIALCICAMVLAEELIKIEIFTIPFFALGGH